MSTEQSYFSPEEMEAFMAQRRRANEEARAELERRGHSGPHPRVAALQAEGRWPGKAADEAEPGVSLEMRSE